MQIRKEEHYEEAFQYFLKSWNKTLRSKYEKQIREYFIQEVANYGNDLFLLIEQTVVAWADERLKGTVLPPDAHNDEFRYADDEYNTEKNLKEFREMTIALPYVVHKRMLDYLAKERSWGCTGCEHIEQAEEYQERGCPCYECRRGGRKAIFEDKYKKRRNEEDVPLGAIEPLQHSRFIGGDK